MRSGADIRRSDRIARALTAISLVAAVGGAALIATWVTASGSSITPDGVEPARGFGVPETVPPLAPTSTKPSPQPASTEQPTTTEAPVATTTAPATTVASTTTLLRDLLPPIDRGAAIPEKRQPRALPISVSNTSFDSSRFPIRAIGLEDDGQLEIPDETEIGWYRYGATAGQPGATVLAAHVSWNGTTGPFFELGNLDPGAQISVTLDDGTTRQYEVTERAKYDKTELPRERIWRTTGPESLVLITCGGDFNPEIRRYRHNIVIYAVPVG